MDRNTIMAELAEVSGNRYFCKRRDICEYLGVSTNTVNDYLDGVPVVGGRLYHIAEVADAIMSMTSIVTRKEKSDER